jgi:hypothetical protein
MAADDDRNRKVGLMGWPPEADLRLGVVRSARPVKSGGVFLLVLCQGPNSLRGRGDRLCLLHISKYGDLSSGAAVQTFDRKLGPLVSFRLAYPL